MKILLVKPDFIERHFGCIGNHYQVKIIILTNDKRKIIEIEKIQYF